MLIVSFADEHFTVMRSALVQFKVMAAPAFSVKPWSKFALDVATITLSEASLFRMVMSLTRGLDGRGKVMASVSAALFPGTDANVGVNLTVVTVVARSTSVKDALLTEVTV